MTDQTPRTDQRQIDAVLTEWLNARANAIRNVAAHRASPPEYPGQALVPVADLDRLAEYVGFPIVEMKTDVTPEPAQAAAYALVEALPFEFDDAKGPAGALVSRAEVLAILRKGPNDD